MKKAGMLFLGATAFAVLISGAFAADAGKGKAMFNDAKLGGGTAGKSCNSCHADGQGLAGVADKKEFHVMGKKTSSLEDVVNLCIEKAVKGKALDAKGAEMADLTAYIKSLKDKAPAAAAPKKHKKGIEGC